MTAKKWVRRAWKGGGKSVEHKPDGKAASSGNGVVSYDEKHKMERHQHGPDPVGPGKVIMTHD